MDKLLAGRPRLALGATFGLGLVAFTLSCLAESDAEADLQSSPNPVRWSAPDAGWGLPARTPVVLTARSDPDPLDPRAIPPAPGGGGSAAGRDAVIGPAPRQALRVRCSPSSLELIGTRLERGFEAQRPDIDLVLDVDTDRNCVGHLLMKVVEVAMIGTELSRSEQGRGLGEQVVGHHIVVPIVHRSNRVQVLVRRDLTAALEGKLTTWRPLGWIDLQIQPVCLAPVRRTDPRGQSLRFRQKAEDRAVYLHSAQEILGFVANNQGALGLVSVVDAREARTVRMLEIDHVKPTVEQLRRRAWPLGCTFRAIVGQRPGEAAKAWLDYLKTEEARRVIRRTLVLPD